jgi:cell division protease FtsH
MSDKKNKKKSPFSIYWIYAAIGVAIIGVQLFMSSGSDVEVDSQEVVIELWEKNYIDKMNIVNRDHVDFTLTPEGVKYVKESEASSLSGMREALKRKNSLGNGPKEFTLKLASVETFNRRLDARKDKIKEEIAAAEEAGEETDLVVPTVEPKPVEEVNYFSGILSFLLPLIIILAIWMFVMRRMTGGGGGGAGGQIFNIGKSKAKIYENGKTTNVTFKDVAGLEGAKEEVEEIVAFLKHPKKYTELGAKIPKGALLVGPPGTGKTLLAKAVAGEAQVPFFSLSGSDFVEMFVGVGASRVRDLFKQAKEKSPSIIFIDEIDAIGRARGKNNSLGSNDERENTLNQLLTEMDGFGTNSGVIILAATNRADVLDNALTRAGRFDRQIFVDMPDLNERKEIFQVHLKPLKLQENLDVDFLAKQTPGFSGADIANLCNEAALIAARKEKKIVEKQDFLDAVDRIIGGLEKKNKIITPEEKKAIAFHEAGHATISWLLRYANPLVKVTIVPRGRSLGAAWYLPEERSITTTEQILDEMCTALGGRAAEKLIFNKISTGALSDLEKVTKQAYAMVSVYGLNDKIGNVSYYDPHGNQFTKPYSEDTAHVIDEEVSKLIESQYDRALKLLSENKEKLEQLANKLLEKEVIFKEDLIAIFGERPWDITPTTDEIKEHVADDNRTVKVPDVPRMDDVKVGNEAKNDLNETDSKSEEPLDESKNETNPGT